MQLFNRGVELRLERKKELFFCENVGKQYIIILNFNTLFYAFE